MYPAPSLLLSRLTGSVPWVSPPRADAPVPWLIRWSLQSAPTWQGSSHTSGAQGWVQVLGCRLMQAEQQGTAIFLNKTATLLLLHSLVELTCGLPEHADGSCSAGYYQDCHSSKAVPPARTSPDCAVASNSFFPGTGLVESFKVPSRPSLKPVKFHWMVAQPFSMSRLVDPVTLLKYRSLGI